MLERKRVGGGFVGYHGITVAREATGKAKNKVCGVDSWVETLTV